MRNTTRAVIALAATAIAVTGCGVRQPSAESASPTRTEVVVHTGPGGGSDLFARQVVKVLQQDNLIRSNWPVRNVTEGSSIGAMSYLAGKRGRDDVIAAITPTWVVTPLTLKSSAVSIDNLTPIAALLVEPQMMAVRADSPYQSAADFVTAAAQQPDRFVQVGGSITATDSLTGKALQARTGGKWSFLSFPDSGQRIASLLRGDAQMMIGASGDFAEHVRAGQLRVVAAIGEHRVPTFPAVTTLAEQGLDAAGLPEEFRGFVGPPEMPPAAVAYYRDLLAKLVTSPGMADYTKQNGAVPQLLTGDQFRQFLTAQKASLTTLVQQLKLVPQ